MMKSLFKSYKIIEDNSIEREDLRIYFERIDQIKLVLKNDIFVFNNISYIVERVVNRLIDDDGHGQLIREFYITEEK